MEPPSDADEAESTADEAVEAEPEAAEEPEPAEFDAERYTTVIEQPDWLEAEVDDQWPVAPPVDETAPDFEEPAATADNTDGEGEEPTRIVEAADAIAGPPAIVDEPTPAEPAEHAEPPPSPEQEEAGADEMEVAGAGQGASVQGEQAP